MLVCGVPDAEDGNGVDEAPDEREGEREEGNGPGDEDDGNSASTAVETDGSPDQPVEPVETR